MKTFMIRRSALKDGNYYIDFDGAYEISDISSCTGITENVIHHIYEDSKGHYDPDKHVYYFSEYGYANDAMEELRKAFRPSKVNKTVELTEEEIEYIRRALINEDSNIIYTNSNIRANIFNKLNG